MSLSAPGRHPGAVRNEKARVAILTAASELIAEQGYGHLTIEGIAARAHVGKPTIYRWWSSKSELIAECLVDETLMPDSFVPTDTGDIVVDLTGWLREVIRFINQENNRVLLRSLIAAAIDNQEVATQLSQRLGAGPASLDGRLQSAVTAGHLAADTPVSHVTEFLIGALVVRILGDVGFDESDAPIFARAALGGSLTHR